MNSICYNVIMHTLPSFFLSLRAAVAAVLLVFAVIIPAGTPTRAAGLAEEHTVLYYLVEMQRRAKRTCDGIMMPDTPSLTPSNTLRDLARSSAASGGLPAVQGGGATFTASAQGATPQQAVETLVNTRCRELMSPELRYIGAYKDNGMWTVILTAEDPDRWVPAEPGQGSVTGGLGETSTAPVSAAEPGPSPALMSVNAAPSLPSATQGGAMEAGTPSGFSAARSPGGEPVASASPVVVGAMELDHAGRPVGPPVSMPPNQEMSMTPSQTPPNGSAPAAPSEAARPGVTPLHDVRTSSPSSGDLVFAIPASPAPTGASADTGERASPPVPAPPPASATEVAGLGASPASLEPPSLPVARPMSPPATLPVRRTEDAASADPAVMLGLVNTIRAQGAMCAGTAMPPVPTLTADTRLDSAARAHAADMAARAYFSSTTPDSVTLGNRLTRIGYDWGFLAENIARGSTSEQRILQSWMQNESQCRNIMESRYSQAGIAYEPLGRLWVFTLASPLTTNDLRLQ